MLPNKSNRLDLFASLRRLRLSLKLRLEEWVRREIVDDDPWDTEISLPKAEQFNAPDPPTSDEPLESTPNNLTENHSTGNHWTESTPPTSQEAESIPQRSRLN